MSRINSRRKSCIDVFNAFLVTLATYDGIFEFPCIKATYDIPNKCLLNKSLIFCRTCYAYIFAVQCTSLYLENNETKI